MLSGAPMLALEEGAPTPDWALLPDPWAPGADWIVKSLDH